ncbi:MAG: signal peptidase [Actinomycetota bacterium]|nr:signal peptidase [Actinomycetota bacterium]
MQERRTVAALTLGTRTVSVLAAAVSVAVVAVDHATKWWAQRTLADHDIHIVGTLRLHLVQNGGGAFGLGSRFSPLFAIAALTIVLIVFSSGGGFTSRLSQVAVGLVLGGAVGNLLDRVLRDGHGFLGGRVVDFIDVQWWPVWNVADMGISIGAVLLALTAGRERSPS